MRDNLDALNDIIKSMKLVIEFTEDINLTLFLKDTKTQYAVIRCFEIIGQATKRLPNDYRKYHSGIPWKLMAGMRDKLIYGYDVVDPEIIWKTSKETLPVLLPELLKIQSEK